MFGKAPSTPFLVVGLGNPGRQYEDNRHNVGFLAIDAMVRRWKAAGPQTKFNGELFNATVGGEKVYLLKPQTYMNDSGKSVQAAAAFFKIPLDRIIVIHDELDFLPGQVRIKKGGGAGGHNGIRSIDQMCGSPDYQRVRFGIGHPGHKDRVHGYVLSDFTTDERLLVDPLLEMLAEQLPSLLDLRMADVQNKMALKLQALTPQPDKVKE